LSVQELKEAEVAIVKDVQKRHFASEVAAIQEKGAEVAQRSFNRSGSSPVKYLNPMVDGSGLLRVGGRLKKAAMVDDAKNPIILPSRDPVVERIVWSAHKEDAHQGLEHTHCRLRERWWIVKGRQRVKAILSRCMKCKILKARPGTQVMSDLPECRLNVAQVFADTGVDLCGPFVVKSGRQGVKTWVVIYTCMRVRAVWLDYVKAIDVKSFLDSIMRFHAIYPSVKCFHADQGTNIRGCANLLRQMDEEWKSQLMEASASKSLEWKWSPPHAGHYGGCWERLVAVVKATLKGMPVEDMTVERFRTMLAIASGIMNRRPITKVSSDKDDDEVLTPMHFLFPGGYPFVKSHGVLPQIPDGGSSLRRSHDELRPVVEAVWRRWMREYVPMLQRRSKWLTRMRPLSIGDVVLMVDEIQPRERWNLAVVVDFDRSEDGETRRYKLRTSNGQTFDRDIRKLVILERGDDGEVIVLEGGGEESLS
jgi:hypothetical protein